MRRDIVHAHCVLGKVGITDDGQIGMRTAAATIVTLRPMLSYVAMLVMIPYL